MHNLVDPSFRASNWPMCPGIVVKENNGLVTHPIQASLQGKPPTTMCCVSITEDVKTMLTSTLAWRASYI